MSSKTKRIGDIGEAKVIAKLLEYPNISVSKAVTDNDKYDIVIDIEGMLFRVQTKTTEYIKDNKMEFATSVTNPYKKINTKYNRKEIDLFALYCIENDYYGIMTIDEYTSKTTVIALDKYFNGGAKRIKYYKDFDLDTRLNKYFVNKKFETINTLSEDYFLKLKENNRPNKISDKVLQHAENLRRVKRPATYELFKQELKECGSYCSMGRKYGVSDNAIRKWEKYYLKYCDL